MTNDPAVSAIAPDPRWNGVCVKCQRDHQELRGGFCWDCADGGERTAANRTVIQHLRTFVGNLWTGHWLHAKFDAKWAFERLTKTGDYRKGGYFERAGHFND